MFQQVQTWTDRNITRITLGTAHDLRFIHSQLLTEKDLHKSLLEKNLILEIEKVLLKTG